MSTYVIMMYSKLSCLYPLKRQQVLDYTNLNFKEETRMNWNSFTEFLLTAGKLDFQVGYENLFRDGKSIEVVLYRRDGIVIYANSYEMDVNRAYAYAQIPWTKQGFTQEQWSALPECSSLDEHTCEVMLDLNFSFESRINYFLKYHTPNRTWSAKGCLHHFLNPEDYKQLEQYKSSPNKRENLEAAILNQKLRDFTPELRAIINQ